MSNQSQNAMSDQPENGGHAIDESGQENEGDIARREFFKRLGMGGAAVGAGMVAAGYAGTPERDPELKHLEGKKMAMVIDLQRCTGCGGCDLACKTENNLDKNHFFSHHKTRTVGEFPDTRWEYIPMLCNHCEKAPCEKGCPTSALYREYGDIVAHDPERCIGCKACIANCPYDEITAHFDEPHKEWWENNEPMIPEGTSSGKEVVEEASGNKIPYYNAEREKFGSGNRYKGVIEKCDFCLHRLKEKKLPACVDQCPTNARIFGDLNDPDSEVRQLLSQYGYERRLEHRGTEPKVFYIRDFNGGSYESTKGSIVVASDELEPEHLTEAGLDETPVTLS